MIVTFLKTIHALVKWSVFCVIVLIAKGLAWVLAPVGALFVERHGKHDYLTRGWRWMTTHDAPADEWWFGGYYEGSWLRPLLDQKGYDGSAILRWVCRVCWIWRNPAYQVAHWLGYDQRGMKLLYIRDEGSKWDKGEGNFSFWLARNDRGQIGWMLQWQWFWWGQRCVEVYLGWKLFRTDPDQKCMVAARATPFKKYEKQPA